MLKNLCTPARVYFIISIIAIVWMLLQNISGDGKYNVGKFSCDCENLALVFLGKTAYIFFWTWVLNFICNKGYKNISWFLVLFPFILFFLLIAMFIFGKVESALY